MIPARPPSPAPTTAAWKEHTQTHTTKPLTPHLPSYNLTPQLPPLSPYSFRLIITPARLPHIRIPNILTSNPHPKRRPRLIKLLQNSPDTHARIEGLEAIRQEPARRARRIDRSARQVAAEGAAEAEEVVLRACRDLGRVEDTAGFVGAAGLREEEEEEEEGSEGADKEGGEGHSRYARGVLAGVW